MTSEMMPKQATPAAELERQIMSANEPKNEREWWASREIARLREVAIRTPAPAGELAALAEAWVGAAYEYAVSHKKDQEERAELHKKADDAGAAFHTALSAHLAEVRAAIGPVLSAWLDDASPDDRAVPIVVKLGDLRRLAALAKKLEG